jgi:hypothetical protein
MVILPSIHRRNRAIARSSVARAPRSFRFGFETKVRASRERCRFSESPNARKGTDILTFSLMHMKCLDELNDSKGLLSNRSFSDTKLKESVTKVNKRSIPGSNQER